VSMDELAELVRTALTDGDLATYRDLLAPNAHWGAPDSPQWGCQNRNQIIKWYQAAQDGGLRYTLTEVVTGHESLLVGMMVRGRADESDANAIQPRWQVMKVQDGLIVDICGFEDRAEAAARAGV
jgi:hypothetical protein